MNTIFMYLVVFLGLSTILGQSQGSSVLRVDEPYEWAMYCWVDGGNPNIHCQEESLTRSNAEIKVLNDLDSNYLKKIERIKRFRFHPSPQNLEALKTLASSSKLNLLELTIWLGDIIREPDYWQQTSDILSRMLEDSEDSLEKLTIWDPLGFLPTLKIPTLHNLTDLTLPHLEPTYEYMKHSLPDLAVFPKMFRFAYHTPNLRHVSLTVDDVDTEYGSPWFIFFPPTFQGQADSVKRLTIHNFPVGHEELKYLFPGVTTLVLSKYSDFPSGSAEAVWEWQKLKSLELGINTRLRGNRFPQLDSTFTGFSETTVQKVYDIFNTSSLNGKVEILREKKCIMDLEGLRKLKLIFNNEESVSEFYGGFEEESDPDLKDDTIILSRVTGEFAFKLMPRLRITISVHKEPHRDNSEFEQKLKSGLKTLLDMQLPNLKFIKYL